MQEDIKPKIEAHNELLEKLKIPEIPTIYINGYKFPKEHKVNDIQYFTEQITSLTMESKGQEACSHSK